MGHFVWHASACGMLMMESLLEPFEPPVEKKRLPLGPICFGLVAMAAVAWLVVLAWRMSSQLSAAEAAPPHAGLSVDYQAAQREAEATRTAEARDRALRTLFGPTPAQPFILPPEDPIVVRPPPRADVQVVGGHAAWDRPMPTIDGSYFGQIDPTTGLPKTVYQSDPGKYVVDTAQLPRRPHPAGDSRDARGPRVHAPSSGHTPDEAPGTISERKPQYYEFDKNAPQSVK